MLLWGARGVRGKSCPLTADAEAKYATWLERAQEYDLRVRSDDSITRVPEYTAIVAMGKPALPFVFEKMEAGEFRMNAAAYAITGVMI